MRLHLLIASAKRRVIEDAARRKVDVILVWKLDRAFRSVTVEHNEVPPTK